MDGERLLEGQDRPRPASRVIPPGAPSVSLTDAAGVLGVSIRTIYNRIRTGQLQTMRTIGGSQRVLVTSLLKGHD